AQHPQRPTQVPF
ncbi:hypothetical protein D018_0598B, partial [Vibrio parahaemolyticus VP2007-007]